MKHLMIVLVISLLLPCSAMSVEVYFPPISGQPWDNEIYFFNIQLTVFFVTTAEWPKVVKHYYPESNPARYAGITATWTNPTTRELIAAIIYLPKDANNNVDLFVLGHEFAHAIAAAGGLSKNGLSNPDNCPTKEHFGVCRWVVHKEFYGNILAMPAD